jgi:hypothetical protein
MFVRFFHKLHLVILFLKFANLTSIIDSYKTTVFQQITFFAEEYTCEAIFVLQHFTTRS